ncbi:MAG TPA: guanylate kinase [Pseudomonadales bacterium]
MSGTLFIISAPSGAGKTSLIEALVAAVTDIYVSISYTTRPKRAGEMEGKDYHFVSRDTFQQMSQQAVFLEHAEVFGNAYGTSENWVKEQLQNNQDVILEIDWQGAQQVRKALSKDIHQTSIFILPPEKKTLLDRLQNRAQDNAEVIEKRMAQATRDMSHYVEYDYVVINDDFDRALLDLQAIVRAGRLRQERQSQENVRLLQELLA